MKLYENSRLKKYCKNNVIISTNIKIFFQKIFQEDKFSYTSKSFQITSFGIFMKAMFPIISNLCYNLQKLKIKSLTQSTQNTSMSISNRLSIFQCDTLCKNILKLTTIKMLQLILMAYSTNHNTEESYCFYLVTYQWICPKILQYPPLSRPLVLKY